MLVCLAYGKASSCHSRTAPSYTVVGSDLHRNGVTLTESTVNSEHILERAGVGV